MKVCTMVEAKINPVPVKPIISFKNGLLVSNITSNISWYRNDTLLAGIAESQIRPERDGKYVVKTYIGNCEASSNEFLFKIPEPNCSLNFKVFPNPTVGKFRVQYFNCKKAVSITIFNSIGQKIEEIKIPEPDNKSGADLDISYLTKGLYILQLKTGEETAFSKLILN